MMACFPTVAKKKHSGFRGARQSTRRDETFWDVQSIPDFTLLHQGYAGFMAILVCDRLLSGNDFAMLTIS